MRIIAASLLLAASVLPAAAQTTAPAEPAPPVQAQAALQAEPAAPAAAAPAPVEPTKSADEVKRRIEADFGVTVLRVRPVEHEDGREDGGASYAVTVMNPGGDRNSAFEVTTLEVDARTGALVQQFRHAADGYRSPEGGSFFPNRSTNNPAVLRGHTWR